MAPACGNRITRCAHNPGYHFDALGSTRLLTNASWAVTDEYSYDAWGSVINHVQNAGSVSQPYQYVGQLGYYTHVQDANLPLLQLGVRMYDPEIGRFTQVDPARDGYDWYAYVNNRPGVDRDPSGELGWLPIMGGGAAAWFIVCGADSLASLKLTVLPWSPIRQKPGGK